MTRKTRIVNQAELDELMKKENFTAFPDTGGSIVECQYCHSENSAVYDLRDVCQKCGASLIGCNRFVGLLNGEEIWLNPRNGPESARS